MSHQVALTIITRINPGETEVLKQLLTSMSDTVANNAVIPFGKLSDTHFARLMVLDESIDLNGSLIPVFLIWLVLLRFHEMTDPIPPITSDPTRIQELEDGEDFSVQNQFNTVGYVKPGWFWRLTTIANFWLSNYATRHIFNKGSLSGLKTVHYSTSRPGKETDNWPPTVCICPGRCLLFYAWHQCRSLPGQPWPLEWYQEVWTWIPEKPLSLLEHPVELATN